MKTSRSCEARVHWETFVPQHRIPKVSAACKKANHKECYVLTCICPCGHPVTETRVNKQ